MTQNKTAAFFDIDGTIFRGSLLISHFNNLVKYGLVSTKAIVELKETEKKWRDRELDYETYLEELVVVYQEAIRGVDELDIKFSARRTVKEVGKELYRYTRDRLKYHAEQGHKIILISGSPDYLVSPLAEVLGVPCSAIGTRYLKTNGVYTGEVIPMWDSHSKEKTIESLENSFDLDLSTSYAYGDTTGDLAMFTKVGNPIAINPNRRLLNAIDEAGLDVKIIVERKDVVYEIKKEQIL